MVSAVSVLWVFSHCLQSKAQFQAHWPKKGTNASHSSSKSDQNLSALDHWSRSLCSLSKIGHKTHMRSVWSRWMSNHWPKRQCHPRARFSGSRQRWSDVQDWYDLDPCWHLERRYARARTPYCLLRSDNGPSKTSESLQQLDEHHRFNSNFVIHVQKFEHVKTLFSNLAFYIFSGFATFHKKLRNLTTNKIETFNCKFVRIHTWILDISQAHVRVQVERRPLLKKAQ